MDIYDKSLNKINSINDVEKAKKCRRMKVKTETKEYRENNMLIRKYIYEKKQYMYRKNMKEVKLTNVVKE